MTATAVGSTVTALVLAGSRGAEDPVARAAGQPHKCLVPVGGIAMLARVIESLRRCPEIGRIVVALGEPDLLQDRPPFAE
jgi:GTP:adenosylcobinamide-phosphate guanylyltransferase